MTQSAGIDFTSIDPHEDAGQGIRRQQWASLYRARYAAADRWAAGYGPIQHDLATQARVFAMAEELHARGIAGDGAPLFEVLHAADRIASAGMWLVVHQTYADHVYLDGRDLAPEDFKATPEGHTGGALNMVPAYVGYMAINAITGITRSWLMGQGHTVSAIDSVNLILDNMTEAHAARYSLTDEGLTRYVRDFYSYQLTQDGRQESPLGSHVNAYTAGGIIEGGYLGFAEVEYVHMPLPGERLVTFLSDGAFEEQRGSDWSPRWWRAEDSGLVMPIMIANGRRIDQRTTMSMQGGVDWFVQHLRLNSFDPIVFDGRDPAAFAWAIFEGESRLQAAAEAVRDRRASYPVPMPHGVAVAPKGAGFINEGTNWAHNLPLVRNPREDVRAARDFNAGARRLWIPYRELEESVAKLRQHANSGRALERDHPLAHRKPALPQEPRLEYRAVPGDRRDRSSWTQASPMRAVDAAFLAFVRANPQLRPRIGNPDEMLSNRLARTLEALKFRVAEPEAGEPESIDGAVITALNEEAVAAAAFGNKGGINLVATYEAFGARMLGLVRQEVIFAAHAIEAGAPPGWISVPLILTSHTWENSKNEQSHQDPTPAEVLLGEASHVSRVLFIPDSNTATVTMQGVYHSRGQVWTQVIPKSDIIPDLFTPDEASALLEQGAMRLDWAGHGEHPRLLLTAIGAYQLWAVLPAAQRLAERDIPHRVIYMLEPGRFRDPRSEAERTHAASPELVHDFYPESVPLRVFVSHTRPEPMLGALRPLDSGPRRTEMLGFLNQGGTLNIPGMLYRNRSSWAHVLAAAARVLELPREALLTDEEIATLDGHASPHGVILDPVGTQPITQAGSG